MRIRHLFDSLQLGRSRSPAQTERREEPRRRSAARRLAVEALEGRSVPASLSIGDFTVVEGDSGIRNAAVVVTLSEPSTKNVTVNYRTTDGTTTAGSDYDAVWGRLTFAGGETEKTILVPVRGDRLSESDEWFSVTLEAAKGATLAGSRGTVTVTDDSPRLSIGSEIGYEGGVLTFTVTLSAPLDQPFTVDFATEDGSPAPVQPMVAYAGRDYVAAAGTLTFAPGELTQTITVRLIEDFTPEYYEFFNVRLGGASAEVLFQPGGQGVIYGELGAYDL
jgi:Calx-beta domain